MKKIGQHRSLVIGIALIVCLFGVSVFGGLAAAATSSSSTGTSTGTSTGGSGTVSCGTLTFTTSMSMTVNPGAKVEIKGSYDGELMVNAESSNWPPYTSGIGVYPVNPFSVTLTAPVTPGAYEIHFWAGGVGSPCQKYYVYVTVQNQTPTTPVTNPGNNGGSNTGGVQNNPTSQSVDPSATNLPNTGMDPALPLAGLGLISSGGGGLMIFKRRKT